jgi:MtN3 and saliva related transmembrane protein
MVTVTAFVLCSIYGFLIGSWPIVVFNLLSLVLSGIILALKIRNDRQKSPEAPHASASRREPGMARPG